jgi:hypothetical protein
LGNNPPKGRCLDHSRGCGLLWDTEKKIKMLLSRTCFVILYGIWNSLRHLFGEKIKYFSNNPKILLDKTADLI